jgi:SAM-dependent methyltransferase
MDRAEFFAANRANWDERVPIHRRDDSGFYAIDRFLAGEKRLRALDDGELGDVAGKRLVHLQCHFGLDTLTLARAGAIATGLDFSPPAIAEAQALAKQIGVAAEFVCANVYEARAVLAGTFDIAYVTWGTIVWLPDVPRWAATIASLLASGGFLYFADAHPNMLTLEDRDGRLVPEYAIDTPSDEPLMFTAAQTYNDDLTLLRATRTYEWIHSLSRVIGALLDAGLVLERLREYPTLPWPPFPMCVPATPGLWRLPDGVPPFPLSYSLRARKP